jgi:hypothetical protein
MDGLRIGREDNQESFLVEEHALDLDHVHGISVLNLGFDHLWITNVTDHGIIDNVSLGIRKKHLSGGCNCLNRDDIFNFHGNN